MKVVMEGEAAPATQQVQVQETEHIHLKGPARDQQAELWDKLAAKTEPSEKPITKEEVQQGEPQAETQPLPDRALVDKELRAFVQAQSTPKPDPIQEQAARLEMALNQLAQPSQENIPTEQLILQKLDSVETRLAQREQEDRQRAFKAEYDARVAELRSKFTDSITEENYPGITALGKKELVFNDLLAALQAEEDISQEDLLSRHEQALKADYERLKAVYESSKAATVSKKTPKPTPKPQTEDPAAIHLSDFTSKKDAQAALWERISGGAE